MNHKQPLLPIDQDHYQWAQVSYPLPQDEVLSLSGFAGVLRRQRWLIVAAAVLSLGVGGAYTARASPVYESSSTLRFEQEQINLPLLVQQLSTENRIGTEIEVLQQRTAAMEVIDSLGLRAELRKPRHARVSEYFSLLHVAPSADTGTLLLRAGVGETFSVRRADSNRILETGTVGDSVKIGGIAFALRRSVALPSELELVISSPDQAFRQFASTLNVSRPSREADLISVRFRSPDPVVAAAVANLLTTQVISRRQQVQLTHTGATVTFLKQQLDTLGIHLRSAEDSLRAYRELAGVVDAQEQARTQVGRLAQLQADRGGVEAERAALAALLNQMDSSAVDSGGRVSSRRLISFPTLFRNQAASELLGSLARVENDRAALLTRRTLDDPDVQVLTVRIHDLDSQLRGIAETYLQGLTNQVVSLGDVAKRFGGALDSLPAKEVQAARLDRNVRVQLELFTLIQTRLKEAEITRAMDDPSVRVVDTAVAAETPSQPKPLINLALSMLLGITLGVGVAIARELTDRSVRSRADAVHVTGLPILGVIPRLNRFGARPRNASRAGIKAANPAGSINSPIVAHQAAARIARLLITEPGTAAAYSESFNHLFTNLTLGFAGRPQKFLVVTSPLPGEGKTLTAANFALSLTSRGQRVLLIDGDLRCGLLNEVFGVAREPGLTELLRGEVRFEEIARPIKLANGTELTLLPTGAQFSTRGQLLVVERLRSVFSELSHKFDTVIIDSPPINLLADAALLGAAADAVLLVVRAGHTQSDTLRYAMEQLAAARAPVIGTLLNDINPRREADDQSYRYLAEVERYHVATDRGLS